MIKKTELIIHKIPLIKVFYKAIKQILETLLKGNSKAFSIKNSINVNYSIFKIFLWNLKN